jgi:antibiotic biosynthesis monooxygenase (ABM) superfamily enzyme
LRRNAALVGYALIGWAACGAMIAITRQSLSMSSTLIVHAVIAPVVFALLWTHFFRRHPGATLLHTSLVLAAIVIALDAFFVAPVVEHSYAMFRSPGTWIPFASI